MYRQRKYERKLKPNSRRNSQGLEGRTEVVYPTITLEQLSPDNWSAVLCDIWYHVVEVAENVDEGRGVRSTAPGGWVGFYAEIEVETSERGNQSRFSQQGRNGRCRLWGYWRSPRHRRRGKINGDFHGGRGWSCSKGFSCFGIWGELVLAG